MATKTTAKSTAKATETVELTPLQAVEAGIKQVVADHDINIQKSKYKAMRAIAWQAFVEAIEAGDFDALVERASANVGDLPAGWELDAARKPAPKATAKKPAPVKAEAAEKPAPTKKAPAKKPAAKPAPRRRPAKSAPAATTEEA
jgi:hypothetical protein